jgi:hypothetical protein
MAGWRAARSPGGPLFSPTARRVPEGEAARAGLFMTGVAS